jgi:hypothetical protein
MIRAGVGVAAREEGANMDMGVMGRLAPPIYPGPGVFRPLSLRRIDESMLRRPMGMSGCVAEGGGVGSPPGKLGPGAA